MLSVLRILMAFHVVNDNEVNNGHMYVCMYACMHVCMRVCVCMYVYMCCMHACMHVCMYVCMCCMHACIYVCNACMYVGRKEMFYLTTHSTHFIYGYMSSHIW